MHIHCTVCTGYTHSWVGELEVFQESQAHDYETCHHKSKRTNSPNNLLAVEICRMRRREGGREGRERERKGKREGEGVGGEEERQ